MSQGTYWYMHAVDFNLYISDDGANVKGVPGFWLTIFKNVDMLAEMVQVSQQFSCVAKWACFSLEESLSSICAFSSFVGHLEKF